MYTTRIAVTSALFAMFMADSAMAQFRPGVTPPKSANGEMKYFRVTLNNESNVTIVFTIQWDGRATESVSVDPGKTLVAEMKQPPAPKKPNLTVTYKPGPTSASVIKVLESGHIDPRTNNPGWIYDFVSLNTNLGKMIDLRKQ